MTPTPLYPFARRNETRMARRLHSLRAETIVTLLAKQLDVERKRIFRQARLVEDLGATPLALVQMALSLEEHFDIEIPEEDLSILLTVDDVLAYVDRVRPISNSGLAVDG